MCWLKCPEATTKVACKDVYDWDREAAVMAVNLPLLVGFLMSGLEVTSPQGWRFNIFTVSGVFYVVW